MVVIPPPSMISKFLQYLVNLIVEDNFEELYLRGLLYIHPSEQGNPQVTITRFRESFSQQSGAIVVPPLEAFSSFRMYGGELAPVIVEFDLWYDNRPSELMMVIPIIQCGDNCVCGYIYDVLFS